MKPNLTALLLLGLIACTKEIPFESNIESKMVINSLCTPDSVLKLSISFSNSITDAYPESFVYFDATLYEDSILIWDSVITLGKTITNIKPLSNKGYELRIASESFGLAVANDTIPTKINIAKAELVFPTNIDEYGSYWGEAQITFNDPVDEQNYYELLVFSEDKHYWNNFTDYQVTDPVILNEGDLDYHPTSFFFSDELFNGLTYTMKMKGTSGVSINSDGVKPITRFYAELRSVSRNYYLYRKYYTRHKNNQQIQIDDFYDFVYMGEPISMFTNVYNGYGIFAGYQSSKVELNFKY